MVLFVVICAFHKYLIASTCLRNKSGASVDGNSKKCHIIVLETKVDIIKLGERGEKMVNKAQSHGMNLSTVATVLKDKK